MVEAKDKAIADTGTQSNPVPVKKDPFSLFGKVVAVILVLGLLLGGGYYLGTNFGNKKATSPSPTPSQSPSVAPTSSVKTQESPTPTVSQAPSVKTVTSGPASGTSYSAYSVDIPTGWTDVKEKTDITDKLIISKDAYSLTIYQAPMGGGGCLYPGSPPAEMAQSFTDFVEITGSSSSLRRSWNKSGNPAGTVAYTVCQKGSDGSFGSPTAYGAVSVKAPDSPNDKIMADIDSMIASLVKK